MRLRFLLIFILTVLLISCSKDKKIVYEASAAKDPYLLYKEGLNAFEDRDLLYASKKFDEAELNFDTPDFAAKSAIMSSYSLYGINFYKEAEENLNRYLKNYPADKNVMYAHYLLAVIQFEQISDEKMILNL